jgi:hypothetical protein
MSRPEVDRGLVALLDDVVDRPVAERRPAQVEVDRELDAEIRCLHHEIERALSFGDHAAAGGRARTAAKIDGRGLHEDGGAGLEVGDGVGVRRGRGRQQREGQEIERVGSHDRVEPGPGAAFPKRPGGRPERGG